MEDIKEIPDFPNYFVDKQGNVYSNKTNQMVQLKPYISKSCAYLMIKLINTNKQRKTCLIHRLVATTFLENKENYKVVNHKDGNIYNNCVENLEWCTTKYNVQQSYKTMTPNRNCRKADLYYKGNFIKTFNSIAKACRYAAKLGGNYCALEKYLTSAGFEIITKHRKPDTVFNHEKKYDTRPIYVYQNQRLLHIFRNTTQVIEWFSSQGITVSRSTVINYAKANKILHGYTLTKHKQNV